MRSALFQEELSEQRRRGMTETQKFIVDTMDRPVPQCLTTSRKERRMQPIVRKVLGFVIIAVLAGCAGPTEQLTMQRPQQGTQPQAPQMVTFPNGTTFGGASGRQASELAQIIVDSNNNMRDYQQLQGTESKNLQTSQQALAMLEQLSNEQGTGQITLFFPTGSAELRQGSEQGERLIRFLDYISRESRGREVLFVLIGSASATGSLQTNERLSRERSQAPEPIIDQYLVNVPHKYFKVYGLGDMLSPKGATLTVDQRYQNVRIIAVYQTDQVPVLPSAQRS
jgi:outer membrane protein OmpA-like peptidoglycan-associated protein